MLGFHVAAVLALLPQWFFLKNYSERTELEGKQQLYGSMEETYPSTTNASRITPACRAISHRKRIRTRTAVTKVEESEVATDSWSETTSFQQSFHLLPSEIFNSQRTEHLCALLLRKSRIGICKCLERCVFAMQRNRRKLLLRDPPFLTPQMRRERHNKLIAYRVLRLESASA